MLCHLRFQLFLQAYYLISANAKLVEDGNDERFKLLIRSWEIAFRNIDDNQLGYAVERFLTEVTEVNRSMVVSAKLLELCQPKERPFNENIVPSVIGQLILNWRDENRLVKKLSESFTEGNMFPSHVCTLDDFTRFRRSNSGDTDSDGFNIIRGKTGASDG